MNHGKREEDKKKKAQFNGKTVITAVLLWFILNSPFTAIFLLLDIEFLENKAWMCLRHFHYKLDDGTNRYAPMCTDFSILKCDFANKSRFIFPTISRYTSVRLPKNEKCIASQSPNKMQVSPNQNPLLLWYTLAIILWLHDYSNGPVRYKQPGRHRLRQTQTDVERCAAAEQN